MPSALPASPAPVVIAIDPHKASWTAVAVDSRLQPLATIRVEVSRGGYLKLRRFARRWSNAAWAIEGATGLGAALTARLAADGVDVVDVPAKLARRVRMLSTGHGRKTDQADALSVGIAAHTATRLSTAVVDEASAALRVLTEHRDDLVRSRTQAINRLHALLAQLIPAGLPRGLTADTAAAALRNIRPRAVLARTLRQVAVEPNFYGSPDVSVGGSAWLRARHAVPCLRFRLSRSVPWMVGGRRAKAQRMGSAAGGRAFCY